MKHVVGLLLFFVMSCGGSGGDSAGVPEKNNPTKDTPKFGAGVEDQLVPQIYKELDEAIIFGRDNVKLLAFVEPISFGDVRNNDVEFPESLNQIEMFGEKSSFYFSPTNETISQRLAKYADDIVVKNNISPAQTKKYNNSMAFLYDDVPNKKESASFKAYKRYEVQYNSLTSDLNDANTQATYEVIKELRDHLRDEWELEGYRDQVDIALMVVESYESNLSSQDVKSIKSFLRAPHKPDMMFLKQSLKSQSGWRIYQYEKDKARVEFDAVLTPVYWSSIFDSPYFNINAWENLSWVISDGDYQSELSNELLPRLVKDIVLIENIEIEYPNAQYVGAIKQKVKVGKDFSIGSFQVKAKEIVIESETKILIKSAFAFGVIDKAVSSNH